MMSNHSGEAARANIMRNIEYRYGNNLGLDDVIDLYRKSTLVREDLSMIKRSSLT